MNQATTYILLGAVITGITELLSRLRAADYWTAVTIGCAAIVGGLFGLGHVEGLNLISGIAAGFGASGALTGVSLIGQHSGGVARAAIRRTK